MAIVPIKPPPVGEHARILGESVTDKAVLRRQLLARRAQLTDAQRALRDAALTTQLWDWLTNTLPPNATLAAYWAFRGEVDLHELWTQWQARGGAVYLPVVHRPNAPLGFAPFTDKTLLCAGAYGILEPTTPVLAAHQFTPDALFMPCVAANAHGHRLGYGAGFYDRTLPLLPNHPLFIGVLDEWAHLPFAADAHDVPVHVLALG